MARAERVLPGGFEFALRECRQVYHGEPLGEASVEWRQLWMRWAEAEPEKALKASLGMDPEGGATALVFLAIARQNPQMARTLLEHANGSEKTHLLDEPNGAQLAGIVAREWWREESETALAWVKRLPESIRGEAWRAVVSAAAMEDAAKAAAIVIEMPGGRERELASAQVAEIWVTRSPVETMEWVRTLSEEDRRRAAPQALTAWAEIDGAGAAGYLVGEGRSQSSAGGANDQGSSGTSPHLLLEMAAVAGTWTKRDPVAAAQWVAQQPEGPLKSEAMEHVLWHWTAAAPEEASRWLDAQPSGPARDAGMAMLSQNIAPNDPAAATAWANAMTPGPRRDAALQQALNAWLRRDHSAATDWRNGRGE